MVSEVLAVGAIRVNHLPVAVPDDKDLSADLGEPRPMIRCQCRIQALTAEQLEAETDDVVQ